MRAARSSSPARWPPRGATRTVPESSASAPVIGGSRRSGRQVADVAAVMFPIDGEVPLCTGTLVAPPSC